MTWKLTFTVFDGKYSRSSMTLYLPDSYTWAQVDEWAIAFAQRADVLIEGAITGCSVSREVALSGLKPLAGESSDVEERIPYQFKVAGASQRVKLNFPTSQKAAWITGSGLYTAAADAMFGHLTAATSGGFPANPCDSRGNVFTERTPNPSNKISKSPKRKNDSRVAGILGGRANK
jgi:hypothetical protein